MRSISEARWQRWAWIGVLLLSILTAALGVYYQPWWAATITCLTVFVPMTIAIGGILLL